MIRYDTVYQYNHIKSYNRLRATCSIIELQLLAFANKIGKRFRDALGRVQVGVVVHTSPIYICVLTMIRDDGMSKDAIINYDTICYSMIYYGRKRGNRKLWRSRPISSTSLTVLTTGRKKKRPRRFSTTITRSRTQPLTTNSLHCFKKRSTESLD
jgi:hypothetical protein